VASIDVAMLAFGGPGSVAEVGHFIETMTGAAPAPETLAAVTRRYEAIGGRSPLPDITARQAAALQAAMVAQLGVEVRVRPGYLYSSPNVADCLAELDPRDTAVLPMSPFSSRFTTGAYRAALAAAGRTELSFVDGWHADRRYLAAVSRRLHETLDGADASEFAVLFTAHNVPLETVAEGDPYVEQLQQTVAQLLPGLMPGDWRLAFQSKGRRGGEWLEPEVVPAVHDLAAAGWKNLLVVPLGFVADHVETLYDLDVELRDVAESSGMAFLRSRALNDAPFFIEALADIVIDHLAHRPLTGPVDLGRGGPFGPGGSLGFGGPFGPDDVPEPGDGHGA
jgi:protoporphyrin/coproporphyrin ferrochelatase